MIQRLRRLAADPLTGNGYLLVSSSALTSALGMVFWAVAARAYPAAGVGIASALIAALSVLGTIAQLNLLNALNRFLPVAGGRARRLVVSAYGAAALAGIAVGAVFVLGVSSFSPELADALAGGRAWLWFPLVVALWTVFVLQDGALAGLRAGRVVLGSNAVYAVLKIVLLLLLVGRAPQTGIFWAWTLGTVPVVVVVTVMVLRRAAVVPPGSSAQPVRITPASVGRFVAADYTASMVWTVTHGILPVILLGLLGATRTAYFALAWAVAYVLQLVSRGMSMSLLTEASADPGDLGRLSWRSLTSTLPLLVAGVVGIVLTAPLLLRIFGQGYAAGASGLLRLLALAALPGLVVTVQAAVLRVQHRYRAQVLLALALAVPVLVGLGPATRQWGLDGVGWLWLGVHVVVALAVLLLDLGRLWVGVLPQRLVGLVAGLRAVRRPCLRRRSLRWAAPVLAHLRRNGVIARGWTVEPGPVGRSDVTMLWVRDGERVTAVLKLARSLRGREALEAGASRILQWHEATGGLDLPLRVPRVIDLGTLDGMGYELESHVSGVVATDEPDRRGVVTRAVGVGTAIAAATGHAVGPDTMRAWVQGPLDVVRWSLVEVGRWDLEAALESMGAELEAALTAAEPRAAFTHGDLWLGNVLLDATHPLGLIDWEAADPHGLPQVDVVTTLVTSRAEVRGRELGHEITSLLDDPDWAQWEVELLERGGVAVGGDVPPRGHLDDAVALRLAWLHMVAATMVKSERYQPGTPWYARNVEPVLMREARDVGDRSA